MTYTNSMASTEATESLSAKTTRSDRALNVGVADDETYLHQLGYRQELRRALGPFSSFAVTFSQAAPIAGIGITLSTALLYIGPASFLVLALGGTLQLVVALCIAEAVSAYPLAGGGYQIVQRILGGRLGHAVGWQVGWWLIFAHLAAVSTVAYFLAPLIMNWFGVMLTGHWAIFTGAVVLMGLSTLFCIVAVKVAAAFNNFVGMLSELLAALIVVGGIIVALILGDAHLHSLSYLTSNGGVLKPGQSALWPFLFALLIPTFIVSGFDVNGTASEETDAASKVVPRALISGTATALAALLVVMFLLILTMHSVGQATSSSDAGRAILRPVLGSGLAFLFEICIVLSLFAAMMVLQLTAGRMMWAQARDGQAPFPRAMTALSKDHVPFVTVSVAALIGLLLIVYTGLLSVMFAVVAILWAAGYGVVVAAKIYGKRRNRIPHGGYSNGRLSGLIDAVALLWSAALCFILIKSNPTDVGWGFVGVVGVGLLIYFIAIPPRRRGVLKDVRNQAVAAEHERTA